MTALQKLRHHQGLLVGLILFALFAFVLGEVISSRDRIFSSDRTTVASVGDNKLGVEEYRAMINEFMEANKQYNVGYGMAAEQVYQNWVLQNVREEQYAKAGITVGPNRGVMNGVLALDEVKQLFSNAFGEVDEAALLQYVRSVRSALENGNQDAQNAWNAWLAMKERGRNDQMAAQYSDMVRAGVNVTDIDEKMEYAYQNNQVDGKVAYVPYSSIDDKDVPVSDAEIDEYVKKNPDGFKRPETRDIQYVLVPIAPSEKDAKEVEDKISALLNDKAEFNTRTNTTDTIYGFARTENDSVVVNANTDAGTRYQGRYAKEFANADMEKWISGASKGSIYGPYREGDAYKLSKLIDTKQMADSVSVSHILISYQGNQVMQDASITRTKDAAAALADSLLNVIKSGKAAFDAVAKEFSDDQTAKENGGKIGWTVYSGSAQDVENFLFFNPKGSVKVLETPMGYHVFRIDDVKNVSKAYKVATITNYINPSRESAAVALSKAQALAAKNPSVEEFVANAAKEGYNVIPVVDLTILHTEFTGIGDQSSIVRWAYEKGRKVSDTKVFDIPNNHVVAIVSGMRPEGLASAVEVRAEVEPLIAKDKKIKIIEAKFKNAKGSIEEIAKAAGAQVMDATSLTLSTPIIAGAGRAPRTVGTMFGMNEGQVSAPVSDETGVFVATVTAKREAPATEDYTAEKNILTEVFNANLGTLLPALEKKADIKDNRVKIEKMYN